MIRRNTLNFIIDIVTLLVMISVAMTGLLLRFVLPPGSRGGAGRTLWSWGRHDFGDLHFYLVLGLLALLIVHLALHWTWVCSTVQRWFARAGTTVGHRTRWVRPAFGVLTLTAIVTCFAVFFLMALNSVSIGPETRHGSATLEGRGRGAWTDAAPGTGLGRGRGIHRAGGIEP